MLDAIYIAEDRHLLPRFLLNKHMLWDVPGAHWISKLPQSDRVSDLGKHPSQVLSPLIIHAYILTLLQSHQVSPLECLPRPGLGVQDAPSFSGRERAWFPSFHLYLLLPPCLTERLHSKSHLLKLNNYKISAETDLVQEFFKH